MDTRQTMKSPAQEIAAALDAAMQAFDSGRGISQSELSRRSGVPQATISRTLKGKTIPEVETLSRLVAILGPGNFDVPDAVMALVPPKPMTEQDKFDAYILHRVTAVESVLRTLIKERDISETELARMANLFSEATIANDLHSHSIGEEESAVKAKAYSDAWRSMFS